MIETVTRDEFTQMVVKYHYSKVMPKLNKVFLGDQELHATLSLGWGVRPRHTIQKLFPSLDTKDYLEIGKMCVAESMGPNTESQFLSRVLSWVSRNMPEIKLIFTWADGMLGKVGYIYQAANFQYGGYIWTDTYITRDGEKIHPRATGKIGGRPSFEDIERRQWLHFRGKQFRYVYFLCSKSERKRLLAESTVQWSQNYPKGHDVCWKVRTENGWIEAASIPYLPEAATFSDNAVRSVARSKQNLLFGGLDAVEVSREIRNDSIIEDVGQFYDTAPILEVAA